MTKSTSGGSEPVWTPEASSPWPDGTPDASTSRPDGSTTPTLAPVSPVGGPKGQRQARLQSMLALLGAAALVGVAVIGVAAAAQPGGSNRGTVLTAGSTGAAGATGAAGSPGAAGTSGPTGPNVVQGGRGRGPGGGPWAFGGFPFGGRGGPTGPGGPRFGGGVFGFGGVTITVINGSQLSLKTADGWTRTIDVTGATIRRGSQSITVADLAVGDQIAFRETRNADGTFKIAAIEVIQPQVDGTITEVGPSSVTVSQPGGRTTVVQLSSSTTYAIAGKGPNGTSATKDSLTVGARIHAVGTRVADGTFTATSVQVAPAQVIGIVTATTSDSITIKDPRGTMVT
ncbi:MAG TPA: DUF5666 domain-containing protein, partial [Candidatus Saccharimonadales bacterium]|nr:DUF5666 domain-containing protein [Candidatus Saccharimonadales bacterium]